ncbi:MAG: protein translocase subunit SecD [Lentisphaeria bacterium]|nr:protein translocase subunit SecD [Lentisphaeria bacterium]
MENRPLLLRTCITVFVIALFIIGMYPLRERDYYQVFMEMLKNPGDKEAAALVEDAKKLKEANPQLFQSQVLLQAAENRKIDLTKKVKGDGLLDNRDVMSLIRKNASGSIRLGLDLAGGVEFYLELVPDEGLLSDVPAEGKGESRAEIEARMDNEFNRYRDVAIEILRKRLEGQKIFEAEIAPSGKRYVVLRAPVVARDEKLKLLDLIKMSAKLNFRMVHDNNAALVAEYLKSPATFQVPIGYELMSNSDNPAEPVILVNRRPEMDGKGISMAQATRDEYGQRRIVLRFNSQGAEDFAKVTSNNIGKRMAIVLDGKLYCAPSINSAITGGSAEITGKFSEEEAKTIADALMSGSFPFQIKVNAVFDTDPKLGASNISNGIWVGILSMIAVAVFMVIYYRLSGLISVAALCVNIVLILGAMAAFNCTLTLPGIAGIVLTIGMAVDANVLVFERIREELEKGRKLKNAVDVGFDRALPSVLDANITTLLTSIILMSVGTGAVKGFAVTLSIGILTSLFTALFMSRLIFDYLFRFTKFDHISMLSVMRRRKFDFVKARKVSFIVAAAFIMFTGVLIMVRGTSILGVDFTGGTVVSFNYAEKVPQDQIQKVLVAAGYDEPTVTYKANIASANGEEKVEILIRGDLTKKGENKSPKDELASILNKSFPKAKFEGGLESSVGGLIGWEFTKAAVLAVALAFVGIGVYIMLRYEYTYAMTGVLALMNDVFVVLGIYLLMGRTISLTVVAALLTVIGYSINDKVVIFDRIRENVALKVCSNYIDTVNLSVNQTISRTLLTSITTFIVVFILYLGGGVAINDFVLIMMLGVIVGTASSMFIAAPAIAIWQTRRSLSSGAKNNSTKA